MNKIEINRARLINQLSTLYDQEIKAVGNDAYLLSHSNLNSIRRQLDVFEKYICYIKRDTSVLDWGCNHAPDSCMIRAVIGESIRLYACDFADPCMYKHFHEFARIEYSKLTDPIKLPYDDHAFDTVVASGVLEHTTMDYESLKELHRVLKECGYLIITFLPNRMSYTEFVLRLFARPHHIRLYSLKEADRMLRHCGFKPCYANYHQFVPSQRFGILFNHFWFINRIFEKMWPTRLFCSSIIIISKRCSALKN